MFDPDEVYTAEQVAQRLGTTLKAIDLKIDRGQLPTGAVFTGLRPRRIWGWALNQWLADRSE